MMTADYHPFGHPTESLLPTLTLEQPNDREQDVQIIRHSTMDDCVVPYNLFDNRMTGSNILIVPTLT